MLQTTLDTVINRIRQEELPCWDLYYYTDSWGSSKKSYAINTEKDIEQSVTKLSNIVNNVSNADALKWHIVLRKTPTSNGDKNVFYLDFFLKAPKANAEQPANAQHQQQLAGFAGFGAVEMHNGYLTERRGDLGRLEAKLDRKEENLIERERRVSELEFEFKLKAHQLDVERKAFDEKLKNTQEELKKLEEKYNSNTEAAKDAFGMFFTKAIKVFAETGDLKGLAGTDIKETEQPDTPIEAKIKALAHELFEADLSEEHINEICSFTATLAKNTKAHNFTKEELSTIMAQAFIKLKEIVELKAAA